MTSVENLPLDEAAVRLGVSKQVVSWYIREGYKGLRLTARKVGGHWTISPSDLDEFEEAKRRLDCCLN